MKFSIIIPVYNVKEYLEQCLISVLNQTFTDYEVICVNDGSTDGSLDILRDYEKRYQHLKVIDTENGGTASARNTGLENAKGECIWFVDSDDWIERDSLEILSQNVENKIDILCFNGKLFYENTGKVVFDEQKAENFECGWDYYNEYALRNHKFHFVCVVLRLYRREFLIKNSLFFDKTVSHEDNLWIPQVFYYAEKVKVIPDILYVYRIREGSKSSDNAIKQITDIILVSNKLGDFFVSLTINKKTIFQVISYGYLGMFNWLITISKAEEQLLDFCEKTDWKIVKTVAQGFDEKILYYLLKRKMWHTFTCLYYFDFYVVRKAVRKIRKTTNYVKG